MRCLGAIIAAALAAAGCGVSPPSWNSVQVWGRVTYNGEPVKDGGLVLVPGPSTKSNSGIGFISEDGRYNLSSTVTGISLDPGHYVIFFTPPSVHVERKRDLIAEDDTELAEKARAIAASYPVPKRFLSPQTSGLWVDLEKEPTRVDIDLKD